MHVLLRQLGEHRGAPRLYLDTTALATAGFVPGVAIDFFPGTTEEARLTIRVVSQGKRKVSRKQRGRREVHRFEILRDRFRQAALITSTKPLAELEEEFADLMRRMDEARNASLAIPERHFKKAQKKIGGGDYNFDSDAIKK